MHIVLCGKRKRSACVFSPTFNTDVHACLPAAPSGPFENMILKRKLYVMVHICFLV